MAWFTKFFGKENLRGNQHRSDPSNRQDFTGVMQAVVEETIMATAYWLIGLVNTSLENKAVAQTQAEEKTVAEPAIAVEELVPKVVTLIEQFSDRTSSVAALESRVFAVEALIKEGAASELQSKQMTGELLASLESRLVKLEKLTKDLENLQEMSHRSEQDLALETRIAHLEKLLSRYSIIPKLLDQNRQAIAILQNRFSLLEFPQGENHHSDHAKSTELVLEN